MHVLANAVQPNEVLQEDEDVTHLRVSSEQLLRQVHGPLRVSASERHVTTQPCAALDYFYNRHSSVRDNSYIKDALRGVLMGGTKIRELQDWALESLKPLRNQLQCCFGLQWLILRNNEVHVTGHER